jgi:hypothetical protein
VRKKIIVNDFCTAEGELVEKVWISIDVVGLLALARKALPATLTL